MNPCLVSSRTKAPSDLKAVKLGTTTLPNELASVMRMVSKFFQWPHSLVLRTDSRGEWKMLLSAFTKGSTFC